jgi:capsular exopolysaccharide synthesis family protein
VAPLSLFSEQLRALRTALMMEGGPPDGAGRVIAVTAARPSEGKTTLSVALARALAASGVNVLAVDGDVRQPSFDAAFATAGAAGLTDVLAGLSVLDDVILKDDRTSLDIIAAGTQTADAISLFLSPVLPLLLAQLRGRYEVVILDVPPAFALAEARILARLADAALLCVRWGKTPSRVVLAAILMLRDAQVNLVGAALTRVNPRRHRHSGYADAEMYQPRYGGYFRRLEFRQARPGGFAPGLACLNSERHKLPARAAAMRVARSWRRMGLWRRTPSPAVTVSSVWATCSSA